MHLNSAIVRLEAADVLLGATERAGSVSYSDVPPCDCCSPGGALRKCFPPLPSIPPDMIELLMKIEVKQ